MHLLDLPSEVVQYITDQLPLQERLEVHMLCKKFYSMLTTPTPGYDTLGGHALVMLMFMNSMLRINDMHINPASPTGDWPVTVEVQTVQPSQTVTITRTSPGIFCARVEPNRSLSFFTEECLIRKLAFAGDIVQQASLKVTKTINLTTGALMYMAHKMGDLLMLLPMKYSGEIKVYTFPATEDDIVVRKLCFDNHYIYLDSRAQPFFYVAQRPRILSLPVTTLALSLLMKKDLFTVHW